MPAKSLQDLVDHVRRHSPFYAEAYKDVPETVSHLTQLPIVDQAAFWAANTWPDNRLLTGPLTDAGVYKTGGTTGSPKFSPWTRSEHADAVTSFGAGMVQAGLKPGHRVANLFCAGELYSGMLFIEHGLHAAPVENVRLPVGCAAPNESIAELIGSFGVQVLAGEPMKLAAVAETLVQRGTTADTVELLLFGGDLMFDDLRPILGRAFPRAAVSSIGYASVDAGLVAAPVPGPDVRVHTEFPDRTLVEIIDDETGEPVTAVGVPGRVVVTNLFRTLMPIIRYPAGDRAEWVDLERRRFRLVGRSAAGRAGRHRGHADRGRPRGADRRRSGPVHGRDADGAAALGRPRRADPAAGLHRGAAGRAQRAAGCGGVRGAAAVSGGGRGRRDPRPGHRVGAAGRAGDEPADREAAAGAGRAAAGVT